MSSPRYNARNKSAPRRCSVLWASCGYVCMPVRRPSGRSPEAVPDGPGTDFTQAALSHLDSLYGTAMRLTRRAPDAEAVLDQVVITASALPTQAAATVPELGLRVAFHTPARSIRPPSSGRPGSRLKTPTIRFDNSSM